MTDVSLRGAPVLLELDDIALFDQVNRYLMANGPAGVAVPLVAISVDPGPTGSDPRVYITVDPALPPIGPFPIVRETVTATMTRPAGFYVAADVDTAPESFKNFAIQAFGQWRPSGMPVPPPSGMVVLPLTDVFPVPLDFQFATNASGSVRALDILVNPTMPPGSGTRRPAQGIGPTRTGVIQMALELNNQLLLTQVCPLLPRLFQPTPGSPPVTFVTAGNQCTNTVPCTLAGGVFPQLKFTRVSLAVPPGQDQLVFAGNYELFADPDRIVHLGVGTFSAHFTFRWDASTGRLVAVPGMATVTFAVDAWIWVLALILGPALDLLIGILAADVAVLTGGARAAGSPAAAVAAIATAAGAAALRTGVAGVVGIVQTVLGNLLAAAAAGGATALTGALPAFPLPLLSPIPGLQIANVEFDELVMTAKASVAAVHISGTLVPTGSLPIRSVDRGGFILRDELVSNGGTFVANPTHLADPVVYTWYLGNAPISGTGVWAGLTYQVRGNTCTLASALGVDVSTQLRVEARDANGHRVSDSRTLTASGESDEFYKAPTIRIPTVADHIPQPDVLVIDPQQAIRTADLYTAAVARGMNVDVARLRESA